MVRPWSMLFLVLVILFAVCVLRAPLTFGDDTFVAPEPPPTIPPEARDPHALPGPFSTGTSTTSTTLP